jgi:hypothetical protein
LPGALEFGLNSDREADLYFPNLEGDFELHTSSVFGFSYLKALAFLLSRAIPRRHYKGTKNI